MNANLARLDLNLLYVLHALLTTQSVSKAALLISRSQPATSHALGRLRHHFGDPLLVRDGWQMKLTPLAKSLLSPVLQAIAQVQIVFEHGEEFDAPNSTRRIRIATRDITVPMLTPLVREISKTAPKMSVDFTSPNDFRSAVLHSEADLAIAFGKISDDAALRCSDSGELEWAVFGPRKHPYFKTLSLDVWAASAHVSVKGQGTTSGPVSKEANKHGIERHMLASAPSFMSALVLAAQCDALFTTLRKPFEPLARSLGLAVVAPPFELAPSRATYIMRSAFDNPFEHWLQARVNKSLEAS